MAIEKSERITGKRRRNPNWLDDPDKRREITGVYDAYMQGNKIPEIMAQYGISQATVFRNIQRAREALFEQWKSETGDLLAERVEVRRTLIRKAGESLTYLQNVPHGTDDMKASDRAKAEAALLDFIGRQNEAIEYLLGFREGRLARGAGYGSANELPKLPEAAGAAGRPIVIIEALGEGTQIFTPAAINEVLEGQFHVVDEHDANSNGHAAS